MHVVEWPEGFSTSASVYNRQDGCAYVVYASMGKGYLLYAIELVAWYDFFFSSRRRHTRLQGDWSSDVCSSDLKIEKRIQIKRHGQNLQKKKILNPNSKPKSKFKVLTKEKNPKYRSAYKKENSRSEEHTSELQSPCNLVCRLLLEKKKNNYKIKNNEIFNSHVSIFSTLRYTIREFCRSLGCACV